MSVVSFLTKIFPTAQFSYIGEREWLEANGEDEADYGMYED